MSTRTTRLRLFHLPRQHSIAPSQATLPPRAMTRCRMATRCRRLAVAQSHLTMRIMISVQHLLRITSPVMRCRMKMARKSIPQLSIIHPFKVTLSPKAARKSTLPVVTEQFADDDFMDIDDLPSDGVGAIDPDGIHSSSDDSSDNYVDDVVSEEEHSSDIIDSDDSTMLDVNDQGLQTTQDTVDTNSQDTVAGASSSTTPTDGRPRRAAHRGAKCYRTEAYFKNLSNDG